MAPTSGLPEGELVAYPKRMMQSLIILGASVRAACASARRARIETYAADLFADSDTQSLARQAVRVRPWPAGCLTALKQFPHCPWMYTGALENHPALLARLARLRPLLGNASHVVRQVRDPVRLAAVLQTAGLPFAESRNQGDVGQSKPGEWLRKPRQGSGGGGILPAETADDTRDRRYYWQRRIAGQPVSAVFLAAGGRADLLGTTWQLIGEPAFGASGFRYVGNIAPGEHDSAAIAQVQAIGQSLADAFPLVGLFGVDGIMCGRDFVPVEVNPRFTASVEVLEMLRSESLVARHVAACFRGVSGATESTHRPVNIEAAGKAILYARADVVVDEALVQQLRRDERQERYADIPHVGERIAAGHPIATAIATGGGPETVATRLRHMAADVYTSLANAVSG